MVWLNLYYQNYSIYTYILMSFQNLTNEIKSMISDDNDEAHRHLVHKLMKQLKYVTEETPEFLKMIMESIHNILLDKNEHPKIKLNSHKLIMYLILMGDPQVYQCFIQNLMGIFKGNCQYNRNASYQVKGEQFFKKSKFYTDSGVTGHEKNQIRNYGISYIQFSLQLIASVAKWLPYDLQNETKPSKFSEVYESLVKEKVSFPPQSEYQFFKSANIKKYQNVIQEIQAEIYSTIQSEKNTSSFAQLRIQSQNQRQATLSANKNLSNQANKLKYEPNSNRQLYSSYVSGQETKKLEQEMTIQRKFFQQQIQKHKSQYQESVYKYQKKIVALQNEMQQMKQKMSFLQQKSNEQLSNQMDDKNRIIRNLQLNNYQLNAKIRELEQALHQNSKKESLSNSSQNLEVSKLRKQNTALKTKILSTCEETSEFKSKKSNERNMKKTPEGLQFISYQDARTCFQPFYSNSPTQLKVRLRKAILREKQLIYKDKIIQVGCITKLQSINSIKLTVVFTNISQKPLFNFISQFITREDLSVKMLNNCRNYLQIAGQTKQEVYITVNQIDFRCLLCSVRYTLQSNQQKTALIMPISKLKLAQPLVYTPPDGNRSNGQLRNNTLNVTNIYNNTFEYSKSNLSKLQKVFKGQKKILPTIHKFKQYYNYAILEKDRTGHETYHLKIHFMGKKFYIELDEVQNQIRIAVFYDSQKLAEAEKLLNQMVFVFSKSC